MAYVRAARRYVLCAACVSFLIWICFSAVHVNATTVALAMILLVLVIATRWGLAEAIFTSIACMFGFNYFFLPPIGTLTVADPQNWIALCSFLITAVIASQLSARAKIRAEEASARRSELERLYRLSRAMLMDEAIGIVPTALLPAGEIFDLEHISFYDAESRSVYTPGDKAFWDEAELACVAADEEASIGDKRAIVPVRLGTRTIGALGLGGRDLTAPERDSIANLIAISYERARALDRAAAAEAARRGEKLKTFLMDGIAHDLKTPLTAIKTCVTTLISIPPDTEEKRTELLSIIDEETDRLQKTITEAIQLARIESGKVALDRRPVMLREIAERLTPRYYDQGHRTISIAGDLTVEADPSLLEQAIKQLLENALKYAPSKAGIEIAAHRDGAGVVLQVLDRGPGVSPSELDRIFDKFYRGTRGRNSAQGAGMGLAIAKGIIEAHGGSIWAENRPGGGAAFCIRLLLP